jgi:hypothetical protein
MKSRRTTNDNQLAREILDAPEDVGIPGFSEKSTAN